MRYSNVLQRVGVYAGTFDPVHTGHLGFALQALSAANLDHVYFLPERCPRSKMDVAHIGHRAAMLHRAVRPYKNLSVLELPDRCFSVTKTLPRLRAHFPQAQLVLLLGCDVFLHMTSWPYVARLLEDVALVVAIREPQQEQAVRDLAQRLGLQAAQITIIQSLYPAVSSSRVREAVLARQDQPEGLLQSVRRYATAQWLYTSCR